MILTTKILSMVVLAMGTASLVMMGTVVYKQYVSTKLLRKKIEDDYERAKEELVKSKQASEKVKK